MYESLYHFIICLVHNISLNSFNWTWCPAWRISLTFQLAYGLDGSDSHVVYNQSKTNTQTKVLCCFKPMSVTTIDNQAIRTTNSPNFPFSQRVIFIFPVKESDENIRRLMCNQHNPDTDWEWKKKELFYWMDVWLFISFSLWQIETLFLLVPSQPLIYILLRLFVLTPVYSDPNHMIDIYSGYTIWETTSHKLRSIQIVTLVGE